MRHPASAVRRTREKILTHLRTARYTLPILRASPLPVGKLLKKTRGKKVIALLR